MRLCFSIWGSEGRVARGVPLRSKNGLYCLSTISRYNSTSNIPHHRTLQVTQLLSRFSSFFIIKWKIITEREAYAELKLQIDHLGMKHTLKSRPGLPSTTPSPISRCDTSTFPYINDIPKGQLDRGNLCSTVLSGAKTSVLSHNVSRLNRCQGWTGDDITRRWRIPTANVAVLPVPAE